MATLSIDQTPAIVPIIEFQRAVAKVPVHIPQVPEQADLQVRVDDLQQLAAAEVLRVAEAPQEAEVLREAEVLQVGVLVTDKTIIFSRHSTIINNLLKYYILIIS